MVPGNAFESGLRKLIPAVLIYVKNDREEVLMLHRNARPGDHHLGKWNGLGGKLEADESPVEAASRELEEEAGLRLRPSEFRTLGTLQFPNFKASKSEDWLVFVLTARIRGEAALEGKRVDEGELHWVAPGRLLELNLWEGDKHFIPYVLGEKPFVGSFWYEGRALKRYWLQPLRSENPSPPAAAP